MRLILFLLLPCFSIVAQPRAGQWKGVIDYGHDKVPFSFRIGDDSSSMIIYNGEEKIILEPIIRGDSIKVRLAPFDSYLEAKFDEATMRGIWRKGYKTATIPFSAEFKRPRFPLTKKQVNLEGSYNMTLRSEYRTDSAVLLLNSDQNMVTGTIITDVGDYRYFQGGLVGDSLMMSSFDGVHAFLFKGYAHSKKIEGSLVMDRNYKETFSARHDESVSIKSPFVEAKSHERPYFDILFTADSTQTFDESEYFDKVVVLQIFGTWCPNSLDQTRYLSEWYMDRPHGVEIISVTYEPNFSPEYCRSRIQSYRNDLNIGYPIFTGGRLSKSEAALAIPDMNKLQAFPTLVIMDKTGIIRYTAQYFNGPATGVYHTQWRQQFEQIIEQLISE